MSPFLKLSLKYVFEICVQSNNKFPPGNSTVKNIENPNFHKGLVTDKIFFLNFEI